MKYLRMIWRVARRLVWETATDNTTGLAAQMAYVLLFALAPGTLFLWHLLGLFGTDPTKLHRMYLLLRSFMPPDSKVQDILDSAIASVVVTGTSGCSRTPASSLEFISALFSSPRFHARSAKCTASRKIAIGGRNTLSHFSCFSGLGLSSCLASTPSFSAKKLAGIAEVNWQLSFPLQAWIAGLNLPLTAWRWSARA
jgi:Predicted membrane protein